MENNIEVIQHDNVALIEFGPGHKHNPFSGSRMNLLADTIKTLNEDENIKAAVLYGGSDKSFSVGGDFNEVSNFKGGDEVEKWIDSVNGLYKTVLEFNKPIIAAIDNYAIGFGLQLALTSDYRIGSTTCELKMPEFAMGIACNFGGFMLERLISRTAMQAMLFICDGIKAEQAKSLGLLHEIVEPELLLEHALNIAKKFASYPNTPVKETKRTLNKALIAGLDEICIQAKQAHKRSFAHGAAQQNMRKIIKK